MIYEIQGDILKSSAAAIVHGVASNDPMSQGLSLELHQMFPQMHKDFHKWCHQTNPKVGTVWKWDRVKDLIIINMLTQDGHTHHGTHPQKANLTDVNHCLRALKKLIKKEKLKSIAIPRLATGVGGLMWEEVHPLIINQLDDVNIPIYIYSTFIPDIKAEEP